MAARLSAYAFVLLLLAGCAGKAPDGDQAPDGASGDGDPALSDVQFDPAGSYAAPQWQVGQWWEWEISFGTTTRDDTFCSIVVGNDGGYRLATENPDWAKEEAAFGHPLLGTIAPADLAMVGYGDDATPWSLLSFPITDGKTWSTTMPNIAWDVIASETAELAMTATADPGLADGAGGFRIVGMSAEHRLVEVDYVPSAGWFTGLRFFDTDAGEEGLEVGFRAKSLGLGYTGPHFEATARPLVVFDDMAGFDDVPTEGGQPYTSAPQPYWPFTMGEGTTLYGYVVVASVVGARTMVLVDPGNQQRNLVSHGDVEEDEQALFFDEPGVPGDWRLATTGAGGFSGAFARLFEVTLAEGSL